MTNWDMEPAEAVQAAADGEAVSEAQNSLHFGQGTVVSLSFLVGYHRDINQPWNIGIFYGE